MGDLLSPAPGIQRKVHPALQLGGNSMPAYVRPDIGFGYLAEQPVRDCFTLPVPKLPVQGAFLNPGFLNPFICHDRASEVPECCRPGFGPRSPDRFCVHPLVDVLDDLFVDRFRTVISRAVFLKVVPGDPPCHPGTDCRVFLCLYLRAFFEILRSNCVLGCHCDHLWNAPPMSPSVPAPSINTPAPAMKSVVVLMMRFACGDVRG